MRAVRGTGNRPEARGERGIALVMALLVLLVMALLAAVLMMSVSINRKVTGHDLRMAQALNTAEAGVAEALARVRNGDITLNPANARSVGQIFLCPAGSVPVLGPDSIAVETRQPAGAWLDYSTATKSPDALTVAFKNNGTDVFRYDPSAVPPINTTVGLPIYVVTATGRQGSAVKRVVTEVIQRPIVALAKGALVADHEIEFVGNAVVCGYNHAASTPAWEGENGREPPATKPCIDNEYASGELYGSWTTQGTYNGGTAFQSGSPDANISYQTGFYSGPWDALGLPQADFWSWLGAPKADIPANLNAITYIDNDGIPQNQSRDVAVHGQAGEGMLYVDGDLTLNSWFTYRGLIYIEGDLRLNGTAWILGALIVRGKTRVKMNGGATILYSAEAITLALSKYGGQFVTLSWREN